MYAMDNHKETHVTVRHIGANLYEVDYYVIYQDGESFSKSERIRVDEETEPLLDDFNNDMTLDEFIRILSFLDLD